MKYPAETVMNSNYYVGSSNSQSEQSIKNIPTGQWVWEYSTNAQGQKIVPHDKTKFVLTLTQDGRLTSTTDCNTISGSYTIRDFTMNVGPLIGTQMFCENSFESQYVNNLSLVSGFALSKDDMLVLYLVRNSGTMVFSYK